MREAKLLLEFLKISLNTPAGNKTNTNYFNMALSGAEKKKYFDSSS